MNSLPLLEMKQIHKSFFGVKVLDDVSLTARAGEVLALLGENGAGKSTLIKILNGDYQMDSGEISIEGERVIFREPYDAEAKGIHMIYQEQHYVPELSVAENLMLGNLPTRGGLIGRWTVDWNRMRALAAERLQVLNLKIDPDSKMKDLTVVERQIVEIVKALSAEARIIVMDEPTAALTPPEVERLFQIIEDLKQRNVAVIYISHRLDEVFRIAQRVTVLRDGRHVATRPIEELTLASVVELMVGRAVESHHSETTMPDASAPMLEVNRLTRYGVFEDVSLTVRAGEIVGIFGLMGSGQIPLTQSIFGAEPVDEGTITVNGQAAAIRSPQDAQRAGIGFVPIDRKVNGIVKGQSVRNNITLSNWRELAQAGFFRQKREKEHVQRWVEALAIRMAGGSEVPIRFLSGGNQQKAILARWLEADAKVLILNEPTWGVDVGARADIYDQLEKLAQQGLAVLVVSSDIQEILAISHRILTLYRGRLTGEFVRASATQEQLLAAAAGKTA
jgi:ribose transport system ATP-binding protein